MCESNDDIFTLEVFEDTSDSVKSEPCTDYQSYSEKEESVTPTNFSSSLQLTKENLQKDSDDCLAIDEIKTLKVGFTQADVEMVVKGDVKEEPPNLDTGVVSRLTPSIPTLRSANCDNLNTPKNNLEINHTTGVGHFGNVSITEQKGGTSNKALTSQLEERNKENSASIPTSCISKGHPLANIANMLGSFLIEHTPAEQFRIRNKEEETRIRCSAATIDLTEDPDVEEAVETTLDSAACANTASRDNVDNTSLQSEDENCNIEASSSASSASQFQESSLVVNLQKKINEAISTQIDEKKKLKRCSSSSEFQDPRLSKSSVQLIKNFKTAIANAMKANMQENTTGLERRSSSCEFQSAKLSTSKKKFSARKKNVQRKHKSGVSSANSVGVSSIKKKKRSLVVPQNIHFKIDSLISSVQMTQNIEPRATKRGEGIQKTAGGTCDSANAAQDLSHSSNVKSSDSKKSTPESASRQFSPGRRASNSRSRPNETPSSTNPRHNEMQKAVAKVGPTICISPKIAQNHHQLSTSANLNEPSNTVQDSALDFRQKAAKHSTAKSIQSLDSRNNSRSTAKSRLIANHHLPLNGQNSATSRQFSEIGASSNKSINEKSQQLNCVEFLQSNLMNDCSISLVPSNFRCGEAPKVGPNSGVPQSNSSLTISILKNIPASKQCSLLDNDKNQRSLNDRQSNFRSFKNGTSNISRKEGNRKKENASSSRQQCSRSANLQRRFSAKRNENEREPTFSVLLEQGETRLSSSDKSVKKHVEVISHQREKSSFLQCSSRSVTIQETKSSAIKDTQKTKDQPISTHEALDLRQNVTSKKQPETHEDNMLRYMQDQLQKMIMTSDDDTRSNIPTLDYDNETRLRIMEQMLRGMIVQSLTTDSEAHPNDCVDQLQFLQRQLWEIIVPSRQNDQSRASQRSLDAAPNSSERTETPSSTYLHALRLQKELSLYVEYKQLKMYASNKNSMQTSCLATPKTHPGKNAASTSTKESKKHCSENTQSSEKKIEEPIDLTQNDDVLKSKANVSSSSQTSSGKATNEAEPWTRKSLKRSSDHLDEKRSSHDEKLNSVVQRHAIAAFAESGSQSCQLGANQFKEATNGTQPQLLSNFNETCNIVNDFMMGLLNSGGGKKNSLAFQLGQYFGPEIIKKLKLNRDKNGQKDELGREQ